MKMNKKLLVKTIREHAGIEEKISDDLLSSRLPMSIAMNIEDIYVANDFEVDPPTSFCRQLYDLIVAIAFNQVKRTPKN